MIITKALKLLKTNVRAYKFMEDDVEYIKVYKIPHTSFVTVKVNTGRYFTVMEVDQPGIGVILLSSLDRLGLIQLLLRKNVAIDHIPKIIGNGCEEADVIEAIKEL